MAFVLKLLSYFGISFAFIFLTLAIASGLYILSEQVEEHTVFTKRLLKRIIYIIIGIHILLLIFDEFPWKTTIFSILVNVIYLQNLKRFPFIQLTSGTFIASCGGVVLNHYLWFKFFTDPNIPPYAIYKTNPYYTGKTHPPFSHVASFLGLCVWLIPFALFISLSASDNVLPTSNFDELSSSSGQGINNNNNNGMGIDMGAAEKARKRSTGLAKAIIGYFYDGFLKISRSVGYEFDPNYGRII